MTIEEFHKLGINRNYAKLLKNQLAVVKHHLEGSVDAETKDLRKTKEEIEKKLQLVEATLNEPWSPNADVSVQCEWACKMLGVTTALTREEIKKHTEKWQGVLTPTNLETTNISNELSVLRRFFCK